MKDGDIFEREGQRFRFLVVADEHMGEPWKIHDGHGIVSNWVTRPKNPGERVLTSDRLAYRYYDIEATMKIALRDEWGCDPQVKSDKSKRERAAEAVEANFQHLRAWCNDEWRWIGIVVSALHDDGCDCKHRERSLWGIESNSDATYLEQVAYELADELIAETKEPAPT